MSRTEILNLASRIYEECDTYDMSDNDATIETIIETLTTDPQTIISHLLSIQEG